MRQISTFLIASLLALGFVTKVFADPKVSLDFYDVDIKDMAKSMSQIVGKNFMMDDQVKGKVTIISPNPVTIPEAYEAFLAALAMKGYTIVEKGVVTQIRKSTDAIRETDEVVEEFDSVDSDRMITRIIPIKYINANEIQTALKGLFSRSKARMVAYGPTNSLIVTDLDSSIRRLINIIQKLDQPGFESTIEIVPLKNAQADAVAQKLIDIFQVGAPKNARSDASTFSSNVDQAADVNKIIPDVRTNSLIVTANRKGLERVLDLVAQLDTDISDERNQGRIHVRHLRHAKADEVATLLSGILSGAAASSSRAKTNTTASKDPKAPADAKAPERTVKTGSGNVSSGLFQDEIRIGADPSTNSLVITATPADFQSLEPVIADLDRRRAQVFVEALIMEVKMGQSSKMGVSGHGGAKVGDGGAVVSSRPAGSTLNTGEGGGFAPLLGAGGLGLGFLTGSIDLGSGLPTIPGIGGILEAVKGNENFNVLSSPNILTTDNQEAEIIVGQTVSIQKNTFDLQGNRIQDLDRQDANLELRVTPQINDGDVVTLQVQQIINEPLRNEFNDLSKRSAKTTIVAQNGQTVVIGGLIKDRESFQDTKVPVLGDVPIIGSLFRRTERNEEKINLMVFLTPNILRDSKDMSRISVQKNEQRRKFNKQHNVSESKGLYDYGFNETLNMAPTVQEVQQTPETKKPAKRFDYMNDSSDDSETLEDVEALRKRYSSGQDGEGSYATPLRDRNEVQPASQTTQADGTANPFATVRPN